MNGTRKSARTAKQGGTAVTLVVITLLLNSCVFDRLPNNDERAYLWLATLTHSEELCKKIGTDSRVWEAYRQEGFQKERFRSRCFRAVAMKSGNPSACKHVRPIRKSILGGLDGEGYTPEFCRQLVADGRLVRVSVRSKYVEQLLPTLGYSSESLFRECELQFSKQRESSADLRQTYESTLEACQKAAMEPDNKTMTIAENGTDQVGQTCGEQALLTADAKTHYLGAMTNGRAETRRYWFCDMFCEVTDLEGQCANREGRIRRFQAKDFLKTQAEHGDLISRISRLKSY